MKLCRFDDDRLGLVSADGTTVADVTSVVDNFSGRLWPRSNVDPLIANLKALGPVLAAQAEKAAWLPIANVSLKSPLASPSKVIAAPVNYRAHAEEAKADRGIHFGAPIKTIEEYGLFLKAPSSITGPADGIRLPPLDRRVDHEIELVAVIGKEARGISRREALPYIAAYCIGLDMTIRGVEDRSWRKSYDTFTALGPWLVTADEIPDPGNLNFKLSVNGEVRQAANTSALIFDAPRLVEFASSAYTLYPGDIIMTGTPEGVGPVARGDVLECSIERIGIMRIQVLRS
jgi:2,4-didehydro-3-deoxy-L-rhamnonate hydrolase